MATETRSQNATIAGVEANEWAAGAIGGFVGSVLFGLVMQFVMPPPLLEVVIPAMYGIEGPALAAGWAIHQFHGVVLGLAYVAVVRFGGLHDYAKDLGGAAALGVAYGVLTTLALAVIVMPLWLRAVGFGNPPPFPNLGFPATALSLLGHVLYALPVAIGYALVTRD